MTLRRHEDIVKPVGVLYVDVYPYFLNEDGTVEYLLLKRRADVPLPESWQAVSGKILADEEIASAFVRQVRLKTGQNPERMFKIDLVSTFYDQEYDTVMLVPVAACRLASREIRLNSALHNDFEWCLHEKASAMLVWPNQRQAIELADFMIRTVGAITLFHELPIR